MTEAIKEIGFMNNGTLFNGTNIVATVVIGVLTWFGWMTYTGQLVNYL